MKRKKLTAALATVGVLAVGGVAFAALSGLVVVPDVITGLAQGPGAVSCQGSSVTFTVPDPTWNPSLGEYAVTTIDYSNIATTCVNLGTADLVLTITPANTSTVLALGTATDMGASAGSITLSQALPFDTAAGADFQYLVRNQ